MLPSVQPDQPQTVCPNIDVVSPSLSKIRTSVKEKSIKAYIAAQIGLPGLPTPRRPRRSRATGRKAVAVSMVRAFQARFGRRADWRALLFQVYHMMNGHGGHTAWSMQDLQTALVEALRKMKLQPKTMFFLAPWAYVVRRRRNPPSLKQGTSQWGSESRHPEERATERTMWTPMASVADIIRGLKLPPPAGEGETDPKGIC